MRWIAPAILAGVGGLMPTCSKLAASLVSDPNPELPTAGFYLGLALFFVISFFIGIAINKEHDLRQAIFIGIAAPAIITSAVAGWTDSGAKTKPETVPEIKVNWLFPSLVSTAHAGPTAVDHVELPPDLSIKLPPKAVLLTTLLKGRAPPGSDLVMYGVRAEDGPVQMLGQVHVAGAQQIDIPTDASYLVIVTKRDRYIYKLWQTPLDTRPFKVELTLSSKRNAWDDFYWVLGGSREAAALTVSRITVQEVCCASH